MMNAPTLKMSRVKWKLRALMADRKITNKALAEKMGVNPVSIAKLKAQDDLPQIGGETLARMCDAISAISQLPCTPNDLLEYVPDEVTV
jgi:putative transcriptional regulator